MVLHKTKSLTWSSTPAKNKFKYSTWSEDGRVLGEVKYIIYYHKNKKNIYVYDVDNKINYEVNDGKAMAYSLAWKLFKIEDEKTII